MEINVLYINFLLIICSYYLTKTLLPQFIRLLFENNIIKSNWQGRELPVACGIIIPFIVNIIGVIPLLYNLYLRGYGSDITWLVYVSAVYATTLIGFLDDVMGDGKNKGFIGHFLYFYHHKKITTGIIKAIGISIIALMVVINLSNRGYEFFIDWLFLVLMVNFINLLDLRPGRAIKGVTGFLCLLIPSLMLRDWMFSAVIGLLLAYAPYDFKGQAMLGDTGSNTLGMVTGLLFLQKSVYVKIIVLIFLFNIHLVAEKYSLSNLINSNRFLKWIDNLGQG